VLNIRIPSLTGVKQKGYYRQNYYDGYIMKSFVEYAFSVFNKEGDCINAKNKISFGEIEFGTSIQDVIKLKGTPKYNLTRKYLTFTLTVLIFKDKVNNIKKKSIFYFIDGLLVAGEHKFSELANDDVQFLKRMLFKKYESERDIDSKDFFLRKEDNACIHFSDGFDVSVFYLSLTSSHKSIIQSEISKKAMLIEHKLAQKESVLLKNL